jgi:exodeoxyribonuclease-3
MKSKTLITILLLSCFISGMAQENIKLISYNIWNGFEWGKDSLRREKLVTWINTRNPDVVALQELCAYNSEKLSVDAKSWGHDFSILLKTSGYSVGLTSKYPIVLKEKIIEGMHHGALHCTTNGLEIFVVHLSPFKWEKRNEEAEILIQRISKEIAENKSVVVCGDFNALSPIDSDWYNNNDELLEGNKTSDDKNEHVENLRDGTYCYSAMSKFFGAGLYDVCSKFVEPGIERISCPTQVFAKNEADRKRLIRMGTRIDYILTSYNMVEKSVNAHIINGSETHNLSDHYPIEVELKLKENE